jgi:hypothetical protein
MARLQHPNKGMLGQSSALFEVFERRPLHLQFADRAYRSPIGLRTDESI